MLASIAESSTNAVALASQRPSALPDWGASWLRGGDEAGGKPGSAPPHPPAEVSALEVGYAKGFQALPILVGCADVSEQQVTSGPQDARRLVDGVIAPRLRLDVMQSEIRNNEPTAGFTNHQACDRLLELDRALLLALAGG